jgi:hypothetical protein
VADYFFGGSTTLIVTGRLAIETRVLGRSFASLALLNGTWAWPRTDIVYFRGLTLSKSQADALLSREWHREFDQLCQFLAVSAVVRTDETSWSLNSVWTFLSEHSRLLIFGCHNDAAMLGTLLPKETFGGVLVSDDAAVYRGFSQAQNC